MVRQMGSRRSNLAEGAQRDRLRGRDDLGRELLCWTHEEDDSHRSLPRWIRPGEYFVATALPATIQGHFSSPSTPLALIACD